MIARWWWLGTLSVLAPAGCATGLPLADGPSEDAGQPTEAAHDNEEGPRLFAGEHFEAQISRGVFSVGTLELDVQTPCTVRGEAVLPSQSHAERTGLYGSFKPGFVDSEAWHELQSGLPLWTRSVAETDKRRLEIDSRFGRGYYRWKYRRESKRRQRKVHHREGTQAAPLGVTLYDGHAALGALRSLSGPVSRRAVLHVALGRRLWRLELEVAARESVTVGGDGYRTLRIEGTARRLNPALEVVSKPRGFAIWISDDEDRLPVRARFEYRKGVFDVELAAYSRQQPDTAAALRPCQSE